MHVRSIRESSNLNSMPSVLVPRASAHATGMTADASTTQIRGRVEDLAVNEEELEVNKDTQLFIFRRVTSINLLMPFCWHACRSTSVGASECLRKRSLQRRHLTFPKNRWPKL